MQKTPLNQLHKELGARMVEFGGWEMPVQYSGVIEEHLAVRNAAGLFDVSHMGEIEVTGGNAMPFLQYLTTNNPERLVDGQVQYTALCYPDGGVVDDMTLYRVNADRFMFCVNAANTDKDFEWMQKVLTDSGFKDVTLTNVSDDYAQIALQGPKADQILAALTDTDLAAISYYHFAEGEVAGFPLLISRTGYTGSGGFELYLPPASAENIWRRLTEVGKPHGLVPVGLGARDTLRLEKGLALYGHELSPEISPLEAGLGWIVKPDKGDFVGREALLAQKNNGIPRRSVGLKMIDRGVPREQYPVYSGEQQVGVLTSGTMSPSLKVGIGLALVEAPYAKLDSEVAVGVRGRRLKAELVRTPFIK